MAKQLSHICDSTNNTPLRTFNSRYRAINQEYTDKDTQTGTSEELEDTTSTIQNAQARKNNIPTPTRDSFIMRRPRAPAGPVFFCII